MSNGLPRRLIPVFVGQGIDTKINPALMPAGELLEVENMFYQQTGKLQLRNGFAQQAVGTAGIGVGDTLFTGLGKSLGSIARQAASAATVSYGVPCKYDSGSVPGWQSASLNPISAQQYPSFVASLRPVQGAYQGVFSALDDLLDPDSAGNAAGQVTYSWQESTTGGAFSYRDLTGKAFVSGNTAGGAPANRPPVSVVSAGGLWLCAFGVTTGAPATLRAAVFSSTSATATFYNAIVATLSAAAFFDAKPIPGGNLIAIAYQANAGGVTCAIFDPSTGLLSSVVNTAMDASMCLGWLDDSLATGNMYLATAGAAAGVVVRTMSAATMAVTATNVIDAAALAGVRNVTGHITTNATNYVVLYDIAGSSSLYDKISRGTWNGAATLVSQHVGNHSLYSRSFKAADGIYYVIGANDSTVQPCYSMLNTSVAGGGGSRPVCVISPGEAGGRRASVSSLTTPWANGNGFSFAVAKRNRITTAGSTIAQARTVSLATVSPLWVSALSRARELGGTLFLPGGIVDQDDGELIAGAPFLFYPELVSPLTSAATGGMTASATYSYRAVIRRTTAQGRVMRSAASVPLSVTLGAGDGNVTVTVVRPVTLYALGDITKIEFYRAGPAGAGAVNYNLVGSLAINSAADAVTFNDTMSDANAFLGELLYSTGNILEGFITPSASLLEVAGNRVWIVNAENPVELWPSLEYKPRLGLRFNQGLAFSVTGDNAGPVAAMAAMDGRIIAFKGTAIYVISGAGPNDAGAGSFNPPQAISLATGTLIPGSVVATDDGIMFQSSRGIYLLDRGLTLTYVGAAVEQYTTAANVVDASLVTGTTQARFVMANGRCLVWDFFQKKWTTFLLRVGASTIVACANVPGDAWYYLLADGTLMKETPGVYSDVIGTSTAIVPRIGLPHLQFAKMAGFQRVYSCVVQGEYVGDHTLAVDFEYDFAGAVAETRTRAITAAFGTQYQYEAKVANQKSNAIRATLRTSVQAAGSGAFRLSGLAFWVAVKGGSNVPYTKRLS